MASMRERKTSSGTQYQVRWRDADTGKEPSESFTKYRDAVKFRGMVDAAGQRWPEGWVPKRGFVTAPTDAGPTLKVWFHRAIEARPTATEPTREHYRKLYDCYVPAWLGDKRLGEITKEDAGLFVNHLRGCTTRRGGLIATKTQKHAAIVISGVIKDAIEDGIITANPFAKAIQAITVSKPVITAMTPEQIDLLIERVHPHYRDFIRFLYGSGARFGETIAINPREQVDLGLGWVHIDRARKVGVQGDHVGSVGAPKTEAGDRYVSLDDGLLDIARPRMRESLLFVNKAGRMIQHNSFYMDVWRPAVDDFESLGLPRRPRIHDIRHSHASLLLGRGVPMVAVSRRLGHASIDVTVNTYGHLLPEVDAGIRDIMNGIQTRHLHVVKDAS